MRQQSWRVRYIITIIHMLAALHTAPALTSLFLLSSPISCNPLTAPETFPVPKASPNPQTPSGGPGQGKRHQGSSVPLSFTQWPSGRRRRQVVKTSGSQLHAPPFESPRQLLSKVLKAQVLSNMLAWPTVASSLLQPDWCHLYLGLKLSFSPAHNHHTQGKGRR